MTLSNPFPNAPAREWAQSPVLKRRLDLKADYKKKAWDGERSHGFASWQPVVLSQEDIAKLKHQPQPEPKESPISETPEAFQKASQPVDTGAEVPEHAGSGDVTANATEQEPQGNTEQPASLGHSAAQSSGSDQAPSVSEALHADAIDGAATQLGQQDGVVDDRAQGYEQGYAAGHEQGLVEGQEQGHAAGLAEGMAQGLAQAAQQQGAALDHAIAALTRAAADIATLNDDPAQHFEPLKRLALHLAEELVRGELMLDSAAIERLIQAALEQLDSPAKRVRVALHPDDMAALAAQGKQPGAGVVMVADKAMLRGGVRVTSNDAVVQDLIDNRLGHLADGLLINKAQWLNDSQALRQGVGWATKASVLERMRATEDAAEVVAPVGDNHSDVPVTRSQPDEPDDPGMTGIDRMREADALDDDPSDYSLHAGDATATRDDVTVEPLLAEPLEDASAKDVSADDAPADDTPSTTVSDDEQA